MLTGRTGRGHPWQAEAWLSPLGLEYPALLDLRAFNRIVTPCLARSILVLCPAWGEFSRARTLWFQVTKGYFSLILIGSEICIAVAEPAWNA